jgi:hypothetical protein
MEFISRLISNPLSSNIIRRSSRMKIKTTNSSTMTSDMASLMRRMNSLSLITYFCYISTVVIRPVLDYLLPAIRKIYIVRALEKENCKSLH